MTLPSALNSTSITIYSKSLEILFPVLFIVLIAHRQQHSSHSKTSYLPMYLDWSLL